MVVVITLAIPLIDDDDDNNGGSSNQMKLSVPEMWKIQTLIHLAASLSLLGTSELFMLKIYTNIYIFLIIS